MKHHALALALLLAASSSFAATTPSTQDHSMPPGIAWQTGDVEAAFAKAKLENKPLFLYWGAVWCPPCNQVKATIFNRQDFIGKTRQFIPVYLDGDSPGAQKLGSQFKVRGYPTMILFKPDGTEITRLPGEVDGERYVKTLQRALTAARPVKTLLAAALKGDKLGAGDWQLLADYSWESDQTQLIAEDKLASTVLQLAAKAAGQPDQVSLRLKLKAWAIASGDKNSPKIDQEAAIKEIKRVLADDKLAYAQFDILANYAPSLVPFVSTAGEQRKDLIAAWDARLNKLAVDKRISASDRLGARSSQLELARLMQPEGDLSKTLAETMRRHVATLDKETSNGYERQAVIPSAAYLLTDAGMMAESDKLLTSELKRSHAPYYHMLALASNAKKRGDKDQALSWYEQAYNASTGPATRVQWGSSYISGAIDLAPQDEARIEKATSSVFKELEGTQNAFYERSRRSIEKVVGKLNAWNKDKQHDPVVKRLLGQLGGVCAKLPANDPQKPVCEGLSKGKA